MCRSNHRQTREPKPEALNLKSRTHQPAALNGAAAPPPPEPPTQLQGHLAHKKQHLRSTLQ